MKYEKTYADLHNKKEVSDFGTFFGTFEKSIITACIITAFYFIGHVVYWFITK